MLDGYGLHKLVWDAYDERFGDALVASPADACGRGISLAVRQDGAAADLTGATVYFMWKHKVTGERGTEPFSAVDASAGKFEVYYPAAMQEAEGAVQAQVMVSRGDDTYISSRVFTIRVEPVVVGGEEHEDGFTLFVDAINAYEHAIEVTTEAADAAAAAAGIANAAAQNADAARESLLAAVENGEFDGANGADGFSPIATVTQTEGGCSITITDRNGTRPLTRRRASRATKETQARLARKAPRATPVTRDRRVSKVRLGRRVRRVTLVKPALKDRRVSRERPVPRAQPGRKGQKATRETRVKLALKGRRETPATRDRKG